MGDPESWSEPAIRFGPRYYYTEDGIAAAKEIYQRIYKPVNPGPNDWTTKLVFGPATESPDVTDSTLFDGKVADSAISKLASLKDTEEPFFLAVGFIKPHSPYIAPKKYFDLYDDVDLPTNPEFPTNAPNYAGHGSGELRRYTDQPKRGPLADDNQRRVRQAYYSCISFIDAQIGRVLKQLDDVGLSENTIVLLFGDHGYHLGEQGLWGKTTNFELDTRVPLLVRYPGMKTAGQATSSLVELLDLYPTLADLAQLPATDQLEGMSLAPVLKDPTKSLKTFARSQYPRRGGLMGYSRRTATHRLTQWVHQESGEVRNTELYDYRNDLIETKNIAAAEPALAAEIADIDQTSAAVPRSGSDVSPQAAYTSFEELPSGPFESVLTGVGRWITEQGEPAINARHSFTGDQCLHLTGGRHCSVTLQLHNKIDTNSELSFRAERWTKREPFSFRVEQSTSDGWTELFRDNDVIRVGRSFLSDVHIPLAADAGRKLRFTARSPKNAGILIDEVRIAVPSKQHITEVRQEPFTLPALVGNKWSALGRIRIKVAGRLNPIRLTEVGASLSGTISPTNIEALQVRIGTSVRRPGSSQVVGKITLSASQAPAFKITCNGDACDLREGTNILWVTGQLTDSADIDRSPGVHCKSLTFSNGQTLNINDASSPQRMGVALRQRGDDNVHTFRIPGLATTNQGSLIAVYDIRHNGSGDLPGHIDVGMSRSVDGGRTWEKMRTIMDMGDDPDWRHDGIGDPAVLVDRNTGTIWVAATWSHGDRSWMGSGQGMAPEETGQLMLVRSDDDGVTWSEPINITKQVKQPEWCFLLQGPGKGITMQDGTLVFAAQFQDTPEHGRLPRSTIIYSRDHGTTWKIGTGAFDDTTEAQVVEIQPGVLMLNCRYNRDNNRVVMTTTDMGNTWQEHTTSRGTLIEPRSCMASLIRVAEPPNHWLLFSNPNSTKSRRRITIKASPDAGRTWHAEHELLLDEGDGAGYSCMTMIDDQTIGVLYEGSQAQLTFQRIPLKALTQQR